MVLVLCLTLLPAPARAEEDTPEGGAIVQEEQQEEQEEAPAAESPAVSEQAAGAVAEVDGTTYSDLIAAFDEAQEKTSATVKLLADVATNGRTSSTHGDYGNGYYVFDQGNVTFDLNGHTLTWTKYDAYRTSLVVGDNGRLTVCDGGTGGKIYNENAQAINIYAGTLIIQSGTLMSESGKALKIDGGVVSITGGTIHSGDYFGEGVWINPDTVNNKTATLTISGDAKLIGGTNGSGLYVDHVGDENPLVKLSGGTYTGGSSGINCYNTTVGTLLDENCRYMLSGSEVTDTGVAALGSGVTVEADPNAPVKYIDADGNEARANCTEITAETWDISQGWHVVKENVTISGLNISGEVNLILCDGATLTVTSFMNVSAGSTLNLFWQSAGSGKLTAADISVLGTVTAPAGKMKQTNDSSGTTFEKCFEHDWEYTNNGDTHTATCKLCGKDGGAVNHSYTDWTDNSDGTHTGKCVCEATAKENHTPTYTPNADGLTHSTKCSKCGYAAAAESHNFDQADEYGKKCACGAYLAAEYNGQGYATLTSAIEAAKDGGTVTLQMDVGERITVNDGMNVTIDLNNNGWTTDGNTAHATLVVTGGSVTVQNGRLTSGASSRAYTTVEVEGGKLTVGEDMTIQGGSMDADRQFPAIDVKGGELVLSVGAKLDGGMKVSVEGKQLKDYLPEGTAFTVNGTVINGYVQEYSSRETLVVAVHTTHDMTNGACACGLACAHETIKNGICTVCGAQMVAQDNTGKYYIDLAEAFEGVADGGTVTMLTTLTDDDTISFCRDAEGNPVEKTVTLMMNGHSLSYEGAPSLNIQSGKLIIGDEATISQPEKTAQPAVFVDNDEQSKDSGTLEFKGKASLTGGLLIQNWGKLVGGLKEGTIITSNGTYSVSVERSTDTYDNVLGLLGDGLAFAKYDESTENKAGALVDGSVKQLTEDVIVVAHTTHTMGKDNKCACGFSCTHTNTEGASTIGKDGKCTICGTQFAAAIGEIYYTDVPSALDAATDSQTVKLLANKMLPDGIYVSKTLTLDLDGHSLSGYSLNVGGRTATSQVRTGNLTVIDSSGGNGAVGVTVRDGGTLVFDPKNDHTTLLQLEVWGGTVELYGGKILRSGLRLNNNITLGNLLPQKAGLAYYRGDTQLTLKEAASKTCDLVVKSCSHGGKNGFDKNAATCPNCNAPAVAETALNHGEERRFADLQTALDAGRDGGAELTLLTDVTGDYTIDGTQDTGLNLNGHSIKGTVTVKAAAGSNTTTLSNTQNTTTASIDAVVACKGAKLAGSKYPAVIGVLTLADTTQWKDILQQPTRLGFRVTNADGTHQWYAPNDVKDSQLNNVIINSLPITTKNLSFKVNGTNVKGNKVERGTTVQLCASCNTSGADVYIYTGEIVGNNVPTYSQKKAEYKQIGTNWYYVVDLPCNTIGKYSVYFTATKDGYTVQSAEKKLTVTKPNLSNAEITFPYGNEAAFNSVSATGVPMFVVTYNGTELEENVDFVITSGDSTYDVGPCTLTIKATDNGDYTGSKSAEWTVRPLKVAASVGDIIKTYDGTTDLPANTKITFKSADSYYTGTTLRLAKGTDYEVLNAHYDSADASETEKTVSFTIELKNKGYVFDDGTTQKDFTLNGAELEDKSFKINPATIDLSHNRFEQTVFNDLAKTYEINLKQFLDTILPADGEYGNIVYGQPSVFMDSAYYPVGGATIENGKLSLSINKAASSNQGDEIGTVDVKVETTNYQPFTLTIHVIAKNKIVPVLDGTISAKDITYGQTLADSKLAVNGTMKDPNTSATVDGTFTWTDGTIKPDAGSYDADWTFTPAAGYEKYATVTGTVTVKVKPAKLIVSVKASSMYYTGEEQIASIIASGQSVDSTPVTFTYSDKEDGNYTSGVPTFTDAGTYTVYYKAEAANHEPATGTFTVTIAPLPIRLLSVSSISKTYDGSADVTLTADKLTFFSKTAKATNIKLPDTALTFSDAQFTSKQEDGSYLPSPEVGNGKALSFTMTLTSNNYVFEGKSEGTTKVSDVFATDDVNRFTITKAAAPTVQPVELTVINGLAKTYLVNLPAMPTLGDNCKYGSIKYEACNFDLIGEGGYANSTAMITSNDEFQLTVPAVESQTEGSVGTVGVKITTDNYQDMLLTVEVIAKNKIVPVLDGEITATPITYGDTLSKSEISGKMKDPNTGAKVEGTFSWQQPDNTILDASTLGHSVEWTFTPAAGYEEYATATGTVTVKVNKADPTFNAPTAQENLTYTGQEQALITAGSVTDYGPTMQYSLTENGTYSQNIPTGTDAGTYNVWYRVFGDANHNDTKPASVAVRIGQKPLTITGVTAASKHYDGTKNADITRVTFDNVTLKRDTDYTVTASFDDASVGSGKNVTATVTLMGQAANNYALEQSSFFATGSITKAAAPTNIQSGTLTITNGLHKTYSFDLSTLLPKLTAPCDYGTITYDRKVDTNLGVGSFITLVDGKTGELTLEANRSGTDEGQFGAITVTISTGNYQDITLTINVSAKNRITPTGTPTLSKNAITYGDALNTIALSGKLHDNVNNVDVDGTFEWVDGTHIPVVGNGTYAAEWIFEPTDTEKYLTVSGRSNITVEKTQQYGKLSMAGYTYGQAPSTPTLTDRTGDANAQVTYRYSAAGSGSVQTWDIQNPPALNAGTYRMYASIGDTDNYYEFEAVYCEFVVAKATPTYTAPTGLTAKYGQTLADVTLPDGWSWTDSSESVGGASTAAKTFQAKFTPTDAVNYNMVENIGLEVMVNKADGGSLKTVELTQKYTDTSEHTYTPDWLGLPDGQTWSYSSEHSVNNGSKATLTKQDIAAANGKLTYAISGGKAGDKITITLKASCNNYEDFTITLTITLTARDDQKPLTITGDTSVIYGEKLTLTTTGGSGTGAVTYRIDTALSTGEATIDPETGVLTPVKVGSVSVIATKAGDNDYNDVTSTPFVLMIKPATPTGEPKYTAITTSGKTLKDAALTTKGSTLKPNDGKLEWVDDKGNVLPDDTRVEANTTYKWRFTPTDTNYTTLTGEVELYHRSSSGGGWYDSYYTIKATVGAGGSISPSGNVSVREGRDQTFTITPDKGYAVSNVKIDGKSIGAVKSYTFENVSRTHTIEVIFMKANGNPQTGVFVDVATGSYYEDAVDWAVGNGITQGTDATHFSPDGICTRAQAVTFLWRAAGSPKPETRTMPFTDIPAGSYYYDAVLWAVENGITKGTSDTTFSPNMTCTRAQIVAFLWRSEKSPAAGSRNLFADVKSSAYYADAVLWAAKEDITKGTTNTTFSPNTDCTRSQIVTFLWRCKK